MINYLKKKLIFKIFFKKGKFIIFNEFDKDLLQKLGTSFIDHNSNMNNILYNSKEKYQFKYKYTNFEDENTNIINKIKKINFKNKYFKPLLMTHIYNLKTNKYLMNYLNGVECIIFIYDRIPLIKLINQNNKKFQEKKIDIVINVKSEL